MITIKAPAKLNLYLHVMGRRADGYHLLDSLAVFLPDLHDTLSVEEADAMHFTASGLVPEGADGMDNLAARAAQLFAQAAGKLPNLRIHLDKSIPAGAGLGGGSADAAATVRALEKLWNVSLEDAQREKLLLSLGADVPACYHGRPCRFEGIGETISAVPPLPAFSILLVWPRVHGDTKKVFGAYDGGYREERVETPSSFADLDALISFLKTTDNDLQATTERLLPDVAEARKALEGQDGCRLARMTGSGSCVFGIFEDPALCEAAKGRVQARFPGWWIYAGNA